nr:hypothetical protein [Tanacetum cinerariifolium]
MSFWGVDNHVMAYIVIHHAQPEDTHEFLHKLLEDLQIISEELVEYINSPSWNRLAFYDDDDEHSIQYKEYLENSSNAIAPNLPTKEPKYSLSMGDENLRTIPKKESNEVRKSSVKNLVPIPSESKVTSDNASECDVPINDESSLIFTTFSNRLFDCNDDFTSSDEESLYNEEDIHFLEELLSNDSILLLENKSSDFDHHDEPSYPRPLPDPQDFEVLFDFEPDSGELISAVMNNIDKLIEDECFDPGGGEIDFFANIEDDDYFPFIFVIQNFYRISPTLRIAPDLEDSRARGFVQSSTRASIFSIWESDIRDLIDLTFYLFA